jgi:DNA-binding transcriptional regulator YhcF (GntR family)
MKTVLTRKELAERWGVDPKTIDKYEDDGIIRKNKIGKFTIAVIEKAEFDGTDNLLLRKEKEIQELRLENIRLKNMFEEIREVLR